MNTDNNNQNTNLEATENLGAFDKLDSLRNPIGESSSIDSSENNSANLSQETIVATSTPGQGLDINTKEIEEQNRQYTEDIKEATVFEQNLNKELGLELPNGLSDIQETYWLVLFARIRGMYSKGYIEKEYVYDIFETFDSLDNSGKQVALDNLWDFEQEKDRDANALEEVLKTNEAEQIIRQVAALFPPELQTEFLYHVKNGQSIDETVQQELNKELASGQDSLAYQRLQNYIGGGNDYKNGKVLTVEDLVGKFGIDGDDSARSTQKYDNSRDTQSNKPV
jgi:hypothetical protein